MDSFQQFLSQLMASVREVSLWVVLDVLVVAVVIYQLLILVKRTRAVQLLQGFSVLLALRLLSDWLHLRAFHWLLGQILLPGVIALVILFQPELRLALEQIGRGRLFRGPTGLFLREQVPRVVNALAHSVSDLASRRYGALIVVERTTGLEDVINTGTRIDGQVTPELIGTVFYPGSPLHDGAMILREGEIVAAGCVLPLTSNPSVPTSVGMRHRAALGISEATDAIVIVVSEETGAVSLAERGTMHRGLAVEALKERLLQSLQAGTQLEGVRLALPWVRRRR